MPQAATKVDGRFQRAGRKMGERARIGVRQARLDHYVVGFAQEVKFKSNKTVLI